MTVLTVLAQTDTIPMTKIVPQRLPDLNIPRFCHGTFFADGELTVTGGHTSSFVPTPTAEFLKDGKWQVLQMAYTHDDGLCVPLRNGKVLLATPPPTPSRASAVLTDGGPKSQASNCLTDRWSQQVTGIIPMPSRPMMAVCISRRLATCPCLVADLTFSALPTAM